MPGNGNADTVQSEVIRKVDRITYELLDNSSINWDDEYRKKVASPLSAFFRSFGGEATEKACSLVKDISSKSDEKLFYLLKEIAVKRVLENNHLVPLYTVDYKR